MHGEGKKRLNFIDFFSVGITNHLSSFGRILYSNPKRETERHFDCKNVTRVQSKQVIVKQNITYRTQLNEVPFFKG